MEVMSPAQRYGGAYTTKSRMRSRISSIRSHCPIAHLSVKRLVLPGHEQNASDFPGHLELSGGDVIVDFEQALANSRFEI